MDDKPLKVGDLVRVSEFVGVGDFRDKLAAVVEHHDSFCVMCLLSNRARRAKLPSHLLHTMQRITDDEMDAMSDQEVADIAAWRMGV